jgi:hypothetical protein
MKILLATLAFSNPELLERCFTSWINHVPKYVDKGVLWQGQNQEMVKPIDKFNKHLEVAMRRQNNWGVAGGWNILLREAFYNRNYDGVVIVGSDTQFLNGFWDSFATDLGKYDFIESSHQFNCFYMSKDCFDIVGSFDENFYPAYVEDDDYRIRLQKAKIVYTVNKGSKRLLLHDHSSTVRRNPKYALSSFKTFPMNKEYMTKKWGGVQDSVPKWKQVFEHPFNNPEWPNDKWLLDIEGRKKRLWEDIVEDKNDLRLKTLLNAFYGFCSYNSDT